MSEKVKVILLAQLQGVVDGKPTRFMPDDSGRKISAIPRAMYEELKGREPALFEDVDDSTNGIDLGETITTNVAVIQKQEANPVDKGLQPINAIDFADGDEDESKTETISTTPFLSPRLGRAEMEENLTKIKGIGAPLAKVLFDAGYETIADIVNAGADELVEIKGISDKTIGGILESAKELLVG